MNLPAVAKRYLASRAVCGAYSAHVTRIAGLCREPTANRINQYLKARLDRVSTVTVKNERTIILCLIKYAWENDLIDQPVKGVMRVKSKKPPTKAWTVEELQRALSRSDRYEQRRLKSGAKISDVLRAWILLGYETGARFGDIWKFSDSNLDGDTIRWTQAKTGDGIVKVLSPACMDAIRAVRAGSPDGRLVGWVCRRRQAMRTMRDHLDACRLDGTSKWLRRSGATHIEMSQPGKASLHLGHRTPTLAAQSYIDWGQVRSTTPVTPRLVADG
jgi:integrase